MINKNSVKNQRYICYRKWFVCSVEFCTYKKLLPSPDNQHVHYDQVTCDACFKKYLITQNFQNTEVLNRINSSRPGSGRREKINLNFYLRISLWCLEKFYEG